METKNILERMKQSFKAKSYKELAKKLGVSYSSIDSWKARESIPEKYLLKTVQECSVDFEWLQTGKESDKTEEIKITINNKIANFPVKAVILLFLLLEEYEDIQNKIELIEKAEEFFYQCEKNLSNYTKLDRRMLASFIKYFLTDRDVQFIFANKDYYHSVLKLVQDTKRFAVLSSCLTI